MLCPYEIHVPPCLTVHWGSKCLGPPGPCGGCLQPAPPAHVPPQVPGSWMRWVVGAPGHPPPLPPLLPLPQPKLTPQEKLKLRMQKALNRQCMSLQCVPTFLAALSSSLALGRSGWARFPTAPRQGSRQSAGLLWAQLPSQAPLSHCFPPSAVKADKKAAQEKMIQQEHERQVRGGARGRPVPRAPDPASQPSLPQEREDELRAMARKIRMK